MKKANIIGNKNIITQMKTTQQLIDTRTKRYKNLFNALHIHKAYGKVISQLCQQPDIYYKGFSWHFQDIDSSKNVLLHFKHKTLEVLTKDVAHALLIREQIELNMAKGNRVILMPKDRTHKAFQKKLCYLYMNKDLTISCFYGTQKYHFNINDVEIYITKKIIND